MTKPTLQTYLTFNGRCEEALEFYKSAIGAEVPVLMRFKDCPEPPSKDCNPAPADKVMHSEVRIGNSSFMASDGQCTGGPTAFEGFSLTLNASSDADAKQFFSALADGGKVMMPIGETFFASSFGVLADRFGVSWMVLVSRH